MNCRGQVLRSDAPRARRDGAFTLIELLISLALMMILLMAIVLVFTRTTELVAIQEARTTVYTNARYALDTMENDLLGALPLDWAPLPIPGVEGKPVNEPSQIFWMENGYISAAGLEPQMNVSGGHMDKAGDSISFRSTTTVGDTLQTVQVTYMLIPSNKVLDASGSGKLLTGDQSHKETARSQRGLFTLVRQVRGPDPDKPNLWRMPVMIKEKGSSTQTVVPDQELCHYVISFNLEYLANNMTFSQLDPSPCPSSDPLGDRNGANDAVNTALRIPAIRATLVITEDTAERQERTIQKVMQIPIN